MRLIVLNQGEADIPVKAQQIVVNNLFSGGLEQVAHTPSPAKQIQHRIEF